LSLLHQARGQGTDRFLYVNWEDNWLEERPKKRGEGGGQGECPHPPFFQTPGTDTTVERVGKGKEKSHYYNWDEIGL